MNEATGSDNTTAGEVNNTTTENKPVDSEPVAVYESGKKKGQPKPNKKFKGLDDTAAVSSVPSPDKTPEDILKDRKKTDAVVGAALVMRLLDTLADWVSGGTFGADFTADKRKQRNEYREQLTGDWQNYLATLDIPLHPALVVLFGSACYVAPALATPAAAEKTSAWKEKIIGKIGARIFSSKK